jgi:hypothetical protein
MVWIGGERPARGRPNVGEDLRACPGRRAVVGRAEPSRVAGLDRGQDGEAVG